MNRPYILCHMMMSVDGRIDCNMTVKIEGSKEYYQTLGALNTPTTLTGRVAAQLEMAEGEFVPRDKTPAEKEGFSKKAEAAGYEVVVDTKGSLLWRNDTGSAKPLVIITSKQVTKEYLAYLDENSISWIVCGEKNIDLSAAMKILYREFGVERMAVVGGGNVNGGFLDAGLLDEVSILLGPGIDGRKGMTATFDGLPMNREPVLLKLTKVEAYENGAVWLHYQVR